MFMLPEEVLRKQAVSTTGYTNFSCSKTTQVSLEGQILRERDVLSVMVMCGVLLS